MTPTLTNDYFVDSGFIYTVFASKSRKACAVCVTNANAAHDIIREFCAIVLFAAMRLLTPFLITIRVIVGNRPQEEMIWIDAARIVAFVQNVRVTLDWPMAEFITNSMRFCHSAVIPNFTVTDNFPRLPFPAIVLSALIYFTPEPLSKRWSWGRGDSWRARSSGVVPMNKPHRLAFGMPVFCAGTFRNWGRIAATAFAEFRAIRGIIEVHQKLPFWCQSRGRFERRSAISIGLLLLYFTIFSRVSQPLNNNGDGVRA